MRETFRRFATRTSDWVGSPIAFILGLTLIVLWGLTGPVFGYSDSWQLVINTGTTIITFLMVFLIQSTQNRDARAIHLKLDELIRVYERAYEERSGWLCWLGWLVSAACATQTCWAWPFRRTSPSGSVAGRIAPVAPLGAFCKPRTDSLNTQLLRIPISCREQYYDLEAATVDSISCVAIVQQTAVSGCVPRVL